MPIQPLKDLYVRLLVQMVSELGAFNVRVNTVFPRVIETPMTAKLSEAKEAMDMLVRATPMGRLGQPEEVANAILF